MRIVVTVPKRRIAAGVCVAIGYVVCTAWFTMMAVHRPLADRQADLNVYYGAIHAVTQGRPLYSFTAANGDPFTYPPFAVLALWPAGWMPEAVLRLVWTVLTCAAVLAIGACVERRVPMRMRWPAMWAAALVLLVSAPVQSNLRFGQVSVFVALLAFADAAAMTPARVRGVLVGAAAAIKLTPLLFIGYLLATGQRRAAAAAAATFTGCTGLAAAVLPHDSWTYWTDAMFATSRVGDLAAAGNQSIDGMLMRLPLMPSHREAAWLLASAVLCAAALYRAHTMHGEQRDLEAAVTVGCATLAVSPVSWMHHQLWTVLAALLLVAHPTLPRRAGAVLLLAIMTFPVPRPTSGPAQFIATNARGLCALAVCGLGLLAAWRPSDTVARSLAGWRIRARRALAVTGVVGLLLSSVMVITGLIEVHFLNPNKMIASRWRLALGYIHSDGQWKTGRPDTAAPPVAYTASYTGGHWIKTVGTTAPTVTRLLVQITPTGPSYRIPLYPGPQTGTHVFAMITNTTDHLTLTAYNLRDIASNTYATAIGVTYGPDGEPVKPGGR